MKRLLLALAVVAPAVLANPITDAVKDNAWPLYQCTIDVNGTDVKTVTDETQYSEYSISLSTELFTYPVNADSELILMIDPSYFGKNPEEGTRGAIAYLYKGKEIIGKYKGDCLRVQK